MFMLGQSEKAIAEWLHHIRTKNIQAQGSTPLLTLHHSTTFKDYTLSTKKSFPWNVFTQLESLP